MDPNKTRTRFIQSVESGASLTFGSANQSMMGYFYRAPVAATKCVSGIKILGEVT